MRGTARCAQAHAEDATGGGAKTVVRRLAVEQVAQAWRRLLVRHARTVAPPLLTDDEQQREARLAGRADALRGGHLRGQDSFRVARPASEDQSALLAARKERRDAVEVRRERDARFLIERGEDVEAAVGDRLLGD